MAIRRKAPVVVSTRKTRVAKPKPKPKPAKPKPKPAKPKAKSVKPKPAKPKPAKPKPKPAKPKAKSVKPKPAKPKSKPAKLPTPKPTVKKTTATARVEALVARLDRERRSREAAAAKERQRLIAAALRMAARAKAEREGTKVETAAQQAKAKERARLVKAKALAKEKAQAKAEREKAQAKAKAQREKRQRIERVEKKREKARWKEVSRQAQIEAREAKRRAVAEAKRKEDIQREAERAKLQIEKQNAKLKELASKNYQQLLRLARKLIGGKGKLEETLHTPPTTEELQSFIFEFEREATQKVKFEALQRVADEKGIVSEYQSQRGRRDGPLTTGQYWTRNFSVQVTSALIEDVLSWMSSLTGRREYDLWHATGQVEQWGETVRTTSSNVTLYSKGMPNEAKDFTVGFLDVPRTHSLEDCIGNIQAHLEEFLEFPDITYLVWIRVVNYRWRTEHERRSWERERSKASTAARNQKQTSTTEWQKKMLGQIPGFVKRSRRHNVRR